MIWNCQKIDNFWKTDPNNLHFQKNENFVFWDIILHFKPTPPRILILKSLKIVKFAIFWKKYINLIFMNFDYKSWIIYTFSINLTLFLGIIQNIINKIAKVSIVFYYLQKNITSYFNIMNLNINELKFNLISSLFLVYNILLMN